MSNYLASTEKPLFNTDFDYFRIPREKWEVMLTRLKQMGSNLITTTAPWSFHEFSRGTVDFNGTTNSRRDLIGLLTLCTAFNLPCILKPGPYNTAGVLGEGIPPWLKASDHFDTVLIGAVEVWYKMLSKTLVSHQWPDGPIIALQIEGETEERSSPTYSKQLTEVKWRIWLRKRYEGIEALNEAYNTDYRTVNDVKFPETWANEESQVEKDAKQFVDKVQQDTIVSYTQILVDAGWQIPIYPSTFEISPNLSNIPTYSLTIDKIPPLELENNILKLQQPIQVDPDPADIGQGTVWANHAPIRNDSSVRQKFWTVRHSLWSRILDQTSPEVNLLQVILEDGLLLSSSQDTTIKIETTVKAKTDAYRLRFNGDLIVDPHLKVSRKKLSGYYLTEDEIGQTDCILLLNDPDAPLTGFLYTYLHDRLKAQFQTLTRCQKMAQRLSQLLSSNEDEATPIESQAEDSPDPTSYILKEARRGLSEANAALRRAMASIGELENGFGTILDKNQEEEPLPQPAISPVTISVEAFEGETRQTLLKIGAITTEIAKEIQAAMLVLKHTLDNPEDFTLKQYQQTHTTVTTTAHQLQEPLLKIIAQLRLETASEQLPLVIWRIHDQILELSESLRWSI